eukprot:IDg20708t1
MCELQTGHNDVHVSAFRHIAERQRNGAASLHATPSQAPQRASAQLHAATPSYCTQPGLGAARALYEVHRLPLPPVDALPQDGRSLWSRIIELLTRHRTAGTSFRSIEFLPDERRARAARHSAGWQSAHAVRSRMTQPERVVNINIRLRGARCAHAP